MPVNLYVDMGKSNRGHEMDNSLHVIHFCCGEVATA